MNDLGERIADDESSGAGELPAADAPDAVEAPDESGVNAGSDGDADSEDTASDDASEASDNPLDTEAEVAGAGISGKVNLRSATGCTRTHTGTPSRRHHRSSG